MKRFLVAFLVLFVGSVQASEFEDTANALCAHTKACGLKRAWANMKVTPQIEAMIEQMSVQACVALKATFSHAHSSSEMNDKAIDCMKSMQTLSCEQFETFEEDTTPECGDYFGQVKQQMK